MSSQVSRNPYLKAYRDKRANRQRQKTPKELAMDNFEQMMDMDHDEPLCKAIKSMKKMGDDGDVQRQGCFALGVKAITHPRAVIKEGGLEVALTAMNRHGGNGRLQFDGLELLWRLSMDEDGAQTVIEAGGLEAIISTLAMHTENVRVQEEASGALRWLAQKQPRQVMEGGGLEATVRIMESFPQFSWIQMWACGALACFAAVDAKEVQELGGFSAVKNALAKHETSPEIQRLGKEALKFDPKARKKIS